MNDDDLKKMAAKELRSFVIRLSDLVIEDARDLDIPELLSIIKSRVANLSKIYQIQ